MNSSDEQGLATAPTPGGGAESLIENEICGVSRQISTIHVQHGGVGNIT